MNGTTDETEWPLRPWLLAGLLALAGLLVHFASDGGEHVPWRMAFAALFVFGPGAAAFTVDRNRFVEPGIFAAIVGLVMAGIAWRATSAGDHYSDEQFWVAAGVISVGLALPLFQSNFHRTRFAVPYRDIHFHVWTDALSGAGALAFTGLSWIVLALLNQLFQLVGIDLIEQLIDKGWFMWAFSAAAFGAALGTLRNQLKILATLQTVATLVLSILAVPLAAGLLVFLVALVATGGKALWDATDSATPVLLACAIGAFGLGNAILRDDDAAMTGNRVLRIAALVLCLAILPLTVFAAISMGVRVGQYGLSPERLWGLVAVTVAILYGLAYLVAVVRGWKSGWRERLREANLHLTAGICVVAFVLALPILDFGAISAGNQVARLDAGKVTPKEFDFAALRWDFGDAGRRALAKLAKGGNVPVAELAQTALKQEERRYYSDEPNNRTRADFKLRMQPEDAKLRELVLDELVGDPSLCREYCVAIDLGPVGESQRRLAIVQDGGYQVILVPDGPAWPRPAPAVPEPVKLQERSKVEVRSVPKRYVFIDGKPAGPPLD